MTSQTIVVERGDGVCGITLNRPERLNSFTVEMHEALAEALQDAEEDRAVRAIVLTGAGRGFCAGQDLSQRRRSDGSAPTDLGDSVERHYAPLIRRLATMPKPVVCAVNGVAAGAGVSVALACDIVIAARSARFILSFSSVGLVPDSGATWTLPRLVGQARAIGLALTGDAIGAEEAERWGLIWKCTDDESLDGEVVALAARLGRGPTKAYAETKRLVRDAWAGSLDRSLDLERDAMRSLGTSRDYAEGVDAFLAKRPPHFRGE